MFELPAGTRGRIVSDLTDEGLTVAEFEALIRCQVREREVHGRRAVFVDIAGAIRVMQAADLEPIESVPAERTIVGGAAA